MNIHVNRSARSSANRTSTTAKRFSILESCSANRLSNLASCSTNRLLTLSLNHIAEIQAILHEQRLERTQTTASSGTGPPWLAPAAHRRGNRYPPRDGGRLPQSRRHRRASASACEPYSELILAAVDRGRNAMAIWQEALVRAHARLFAQIGAALRVAVEHAGLGRIARARVSAAGRHWRGDPRWPQPHFAKGRARATV
jgi:hypothetical protein